MAGTDRQASPALELTAALRRRPYKFGFFQLLRRLENAYRDQPRFGESVRPADDPIRLGQEVSMRFAPATLAAYRPGKDGRPDRLSGYFLGLFGPNGPLPLHMTEYARDRVRNFGDSTLIGFADIFHHRMLCLFYRAWACAQPTVDFDRPESDRFSSYVASLFGLGMPSLRDRDAMRDLAKLHFCGRLALQTRNAEGLKAILEGFFDMPVAIEQFVGEWLRLPESQLCRLGTARAAGTLGANATVGGRVWSCQYKYTIVFGPMNFADYQRLLPGGSSLRRLTAIVRNYCGDELNWDVNLILKREDVPPLKLGEVGQLGWTAWLTPRRSDEDAGDLYLNALGVAARRANLSEDRMPGPD